MPDVIGGTRAAEKGADAESYEYGLLPVAVRERLGSTMAHAMTVPISCSGRGGDESGDRTNGFDFTRGGVPVSAVQSLPTFRRPVECCLGDNR